MNAASPRGRDGTAIRTFLIADIRGWTAFTAEHGDEAASALARKFAEMADEGVQAWGGRVVELRGDEVLAVFESGRDALRAATELQAAFAAETRIDPSLPLPVGIGLDAGEAVSVGDGFRGAALNIAARLCSFAAASETIATQSLCQLAGPLPDLDFVALPPTKLKGLREPVAAVRVEARAEPDRALAQTERPPEQLEPDDAHPTPSDEPGDGLQPPLPAELEAIVPLAGRAVELRWLGWHWRRAGHGAGRPVVISGQPGIGKTRLAAELAARAHADGATVRYLGATADTDALTRALAEPGSKLVIVDDLDAAPPSVARAMSAVAARLDGSPTLLLVTHREEAAPALLSLVERTAPPSRRLSLGPLEPDAVRAIAALYAGRAAGQIPMAEIYERTGGVPAAIHRWSSSWAREAAAARLETSARRTSDGRRRLRAAQDELIGDVADLELVREWSELYAADRTSDGAPSPAAATRQDVCPYKGLTAFDADDAEYYFGRERLVAELVARLVGASFLALVGASGSGKSSALRAGLLPALAGGVLPGSAGWPQHSMRPGEHPLAELERALGTTLDEALATIPAGGRLVLVVDQFEEVFNSTRDETERSRFIDLLTAERDNLKVVLAMRADHYGQCAAYPQLARLVGTNQVLVGPLTHAELASVIERPAQRVGLRVEPDLTDALLADLGDEPGSLPLLSTALLELWQVRQSGRLTLAAYRSRGGVQGAVARLAEGAYAGLSEDERAIARSIFLRLAGTGEGEGIVRRRVPLNEFDQSDERVRTVLTTLTDARLLSAGDGYVEVAHEAVLREWPRLQRWLEEDAAGRQLRLHLIGAARDWQARGREPGDLYRGARLAVALEWSADHSPELNPLEREFLEEGRLVSEAEVMRQRRTNRRLRALLAGAGVLLVVALAAGGLAANQAEVARRSEQSALQAQQFARSRELAASAIAARDDDPTLSKLLAISGASIADPPVESVAALHRAWDADRTIFRYGWPTDIPVGALCADLHPSGRYIAASGCIFDKRNDYLEVVDRQAEQGHQRLWSFQPSTEGLAVGAAMFSPDGSRVVFGAFFGSEPPAGTSSAEAGIYVRDALTGAEIRRIDTGSCGAAVVAVSNGTAIAFTSNAPMCLGYAPPRRKLSLESIDLGTGKRTTLTTAAFPNNEYAVSADGSTIVFNEDVLDPKTDTVVRVPAVVARPTAGQRVELPISDFGQVHDVTADGTRLLVDVDDKLQVWDLDVENLADVGIDPEDPTGERKPMSEFAPDPKSHGAFAQFAADGASVFATGDDGRLHQWNVESGDEILSYGAPEGRPSPNAAGLVLVPSTEGPTALLIDTSLRGEIAAVNNSALASKTVPKGGCDAAPAGQAVTGVGHSVAVANMCGDDTHPDAETFTLLDGTSLRAIGSANGGFVGVISPDGTRLARRMQRLGGKDGKELFVGPVEVVDVASGTTLFQLKGLCWFNRSDPPRLQVARREHQNNGCSDFPQTPFAIDGSHEHEIRWSPDGTMIAMVDAIDGYFAVWNAIDGSIISASLAAWNTDMRAFDVAFTGDAKHLVVSYMTDTQGGATRNTLATLSTADWHVVATRDLTDLARNLLLLGPSADGSSMVAVSGFLADAAATSSDKALYWLDPVSLNNTQPSQSRLHAGLITAAALSADGTLVATGATDGSIRVRDGGGRLVNEIDFPGKAVDGLAFISQTHLGVVLEDGELRVVTIDTGELLEIARKSLTRGFTEDECDRYKFDPCPTLEQVRSGEANPH